MYKNKNMKITIGTQVKLMPDMMNKITKHVDESWSYYYNPTERSEEELKANVIRGKMAEYGFYLMNKNIGIEVSEPDLRNHKNGTDGGKDFIVNKTTVDVKSLDSLKPGYYQIPIPSLKAEAYALCLVDVDNKIITYEGEITRNKIQEEKLLEEAKNPKTGIPYTYVNKKHLSELDENFK
jgi:hypothetical protein